jgi:hypothetical protein
MNVFQKLFKRRSAAKEKPMTLVTQPPATNPAAPDVNAQIAALTGVVTKLAEGQQAILTHLAKPPAPAEPAKPAPAAGGGDKPLTQADVERLVNERLAAQQQSSQQAAARSAFVAGKLKDLPAVYQNQLGNDPAKWEAEEQQIRSAFQADFKAAGGKVPDVGGTSAGGAPPSQTVDTSKLSGFDLIGIAVKDSKPVTVAPAPASPAK